MLQSVVEVENHVLQTLEAGHLVIVVMFVVGTFITKAPGVAAKTNAAFSGVQHLLHDADTDGREVRPIPLLG